MSKTKCSHSAKPSADKQQLLSIVYSGPALALISLVIPVYFLMYSYSSNDKFGFPLDDAFIHLTFARNIFESGSYSYFRDEMITSGSTSPLYTLILSTEFLFLNNEFIICYIVGISFYILSAIYFLKLSSVIFPKAPYAIITVLLIFITDKWINYFTVSGMETTAFIFTIIAATFYYRTKRPVPVFILSGLMIWIRPEGIIFVLAILSDLILKHILLKTKRTELKRFLSGKKIIYAMSVFFFIILLYASLNLYLSGSIFPNTFYAKTAFYSPEFMSRQYFLQHEVFDYFTAGCYLMLVPGFICSVVFLIIDILKRRTPENSLFIIFILAFVTAYWLFMPYSGISGRYLVPLIPFFILISISGYFKIFVLFRRFGFSIVLVSYLLIIIYAYSASSDLKQSVTNYKDDCKFIDSIHISAANWIRENTDPDDVIATHEIGAIGFYSDRKLIDIAGLVTKDFIQKLPDSDYVGYMQDHLTKNKTQYIAVMKNWCKVVNQSPVCSFKIGQQHIEIYNYKPGQTHILNKSVYKLLYLAEYNIRKESYMDAIRLLDEAESLDPSCSLTYFLKASAYFKTNDLRNYEVSLHKAIKIYPEYSRALLALCNLYKMQKDESKFNFYFSQYNSSVQQKPIPAFTNELIFYY